MVVDKAQTADGLPRGRWPSMKMPCQVGLTPNFFHLESNFILPEIILFGGGACLDKSNGRTQAQGERSHGRVYMILKRCTKQRRTYLLFLNTEKHETFEGVTCIHWLRPDTQCVAELILLRDQRSTKTILEKTKIGTSILSSAES